ncbi:MAG: hypothetical protein COV46_05965 [Deltaproteobacteria bacterium CG11_big_fil_rev_8_21_14_0_20_49_13]|nr:MAG: hypothetical protein COV46_05965 [Deltaproteobacteria bacterium CG11_big_fil_rev_8_21_14_0_20_49_13]
MARNNFLMFVAVLAACAVSATVDAKTFYPHTAGELIQAVATANSTPALDTIELDADKTYTLSPTLVIKHSLTIKGNGATLTQIEKGANRLINNSQAGILTIHNLILKGAETKINGAALYTSGGYLFLVDCLVTENSSKLSGGAIFVNDGSTFQIVRSTFLANSARGSGGAIFLGFNTNGDIIDSAFISNTVKQSGAEYGGGAIYAMLGKTAIVNTTFANNTALNSNGGALMVASDGPESGSFFTQSHVTLTKNSAKNGGAIFINASVDPVYIVVKDSLIAGNTSVDGPNCKNAFLSSGYNLIEDTTGCAVDSFTGDLFDDASLPTGLGTLISSDVPGKSHVPLLASSMAINHGSPPAGGTLDQLGSPRGNSPDIGAVEAICGDNIAHTVLGEECDGTDLPGASCASKGFDGGVLSCAANCTYVTTACTKNPVTTPTEEKPPLPDKPATPLTEPPAAPPAGGETATDNGTGSVPGNPEGAATTDGDGAAAKSVGGCQLILR